MEFKLQLLQGVSLTDYEKDDPGFVEDLHRSHRFVWLIALWFWNNGFKITIPPERIRPHCEEMAKYSDEGDLFVSHGDALEFIVAVKHREKIDFQSLQDFPYSTIIVDVCHHYDEADPKPLLHTIINKSATGFIIVKKRTTDSWTRVRKWDNGKNRFREFYECPLVLCEWRQITRGGMNVTP